MNKAIRYVSAQDVLKIPAFSSWDELELINPQHDGDVFAHLYALGIDTNRPVHIQACRHRPLLSSQPVVGFRYVGHERLDKEWLESPYSSLQARIEAARDPELQSDMVKSSREGMSYAKFKEMCYKAGGMDGTTREDRQPAPVDTCAEDTQKMKALRALQIQIRGGLNIMEEDLFATHLGG